jgi:hypothetical protein
MIITTKISERYPSIACLRYFFSNLNVDKVGLKNIDKCSLPKVKFRREIFAKYTILLIQNQ